MNQSTNMPSPEVVLQAIRDAAHGGPNYWAAFIIVLGAIAGGWLVWWLANQHVKTYEAMRKDHADQTTLLIGVIKENSLALLGHSKTIEGHGRIIENQGAVINELRRSIDKCQSP